MPGAPLQGSSLVARPPAGIRFGWNSKWGAILFTCCQAQHLSGAYQLHIRSHCTSSAACSCAHPPLSLPCTSLPHACSPMLALAAALQLPSCLLKALLCWCTMQKQRCGPGKYAGRRLFVHALHAVWQDSASRPSRRTSAPASGRLASAGCLSRLMQVCFCFKRPGLTGCLLCPPARPCVPWARSRARTLQAVAGLGLLAHHVQHRVNQLRALRVMALCPVVACARLRAAA